MSLKQAVELTLYGSAAILFMKAVDISPLYGLFNGNWWIPLGLASVLVYFAPRISEGVGR